MSDKYFIVLPWERERERFSNFHLPPSTILSKRENRSVSNLCLVQTIALVFFTMGLLSRWLRLLWISALTWAQLLALAVAWCSIRTQDHDFCALNSVSLWGEREKNFAQPWILFLKKYLFICLFVYRPCSATCGILLNWPKIHLGFSSNTLRKSRTNFLANPIVPQPGIEPGTSAVKARSPNHWTTREFPQVWIQ